MQQVMLFLFIIVLYLVSIVSSQETIAFSAIKGEPNGPYISYQTILVNNSAKFNAKYGVFMCTEPGIYYFTFQVLSQQESDLRVSLRTNRIPVVTAFSGSKTSFNMASGTAILQLEAKDIVYCYVEDGQFYESRLTNRAYTSFSGFRVGSVAGSGGGFFSSFMARKATIDSKSKPQMDGLIEIDLKDNIYDLINNQNNSGFH